MTKALQSGPNHLFENSVINEQLKNIIKCFKGFENLDIDVDDVSRCLIEQVKAEGLRHLTEINTQVAGRNVHSVGHFVLMQKKPSSKSF